MPRFTLHSLRNQTTLIKYALVLVVLFSVFSAWHDTSHVLKTDQECELCLSSIDLEHSIPAKVTLFESDFHSFSSIKLNSQHFHSVFVAITGNRDPPFVIFN
ncbi:MULTISPECIES: hypothetical protein [Pseudoalteromonas]|uniref:Uncharacterized protein n=1 Tax=Pseudoalteromonas fuliginea TaxID=1872678 RepID=A0ABQ6RJ03_9GAMM|nr:MULTISPECIES: hypothetical protein [Pseudoalteromonas]KAA1157640.1 hypothetical protein EU509_08450 [Pseudoalteromonas fuliginea]KAA1167699.1 hypothetical protein EUZ79_08440 [Pseudoalteromonas fuliginea]MDQ2044342.1 hypothetical protein [Pseudoalteromonas sp. 20-92]GAA81274.1 hypothetical protein P20495_3804 [Pseudoalteromonas sp. BSi20495]